MINGMPIFYSSKTKGKGLEPIPTRGKGLEPVQTKKGTCNKKGNKNRIKGSGLKILN